MSHAFQNTHQIHEQIHNKAVEASTRYLKVEAELIEILQQVEQHRVYLRKNYSSLFQYVVQELHFSESVAYNLITVSRKAKEIPSLKTELQNGTITLGNAKRISPILTLENQEEWLKKASSLSQRQLEREIVKIKPQTATPERVSYLYADHHETRIKLELGLPEKEMLQLRRVQDLLCQQRRTAVSLEETVIELTRKYLKNHDPIEKAKRHVVRKGPLSQKTQSNSSREELPRPPSQHQRTSIPASILHQVNLRDQRRCTFMIKGDKNPKENIRCNQTRWIEIHHQVPVNQGGKNTVENLSTLCSAHHRILHSNDTPLDFKTS